MSRQPGPGRMPFGGNHPSQGYDAPRGYSRPQAPPRGPPPPQQRHSEKPYPEMGGSSRGPVRLRAEKVTDKILQEDMLLKDLVVVSPEDFPSRQDSTLYILFRGGQPAGEYVVTAKPVPGFPRGCIGLSDPQRKWANITMQDELMGQAYDPLAQGGENYLNSVDAEIGFLSTSREGNAPVPEEALADFFRGTFNGHMFAPGQRTLMKFGDLPPLLVTIKAVSLFDRSLSSGGADHPMKSEPRTRGIVSPSTVVNFARVAKFNMIPSKTKPKANPILASDFKFEDMGIGGLGDEFSTIFRRAFASRILPAGLATSIGLDQVKGLLLYGPPGTGKTLIARQIGKMLNAREPKVINGPEVLNKYVGQSEENIRKLFADAEKEYAEKGDDSELHIIIFDELDAICKQRGSGSGGGTGVGDNVVNQLLSKMDGVEQLNNILIIGMTNRKDLIDEALLRPGRLEVHIEIELPDEAGRLEILKIHTAKMRDNGLVESDVNLEELAGLTKNFSGAELYGLIRSAASFTFSRHIEVGKMAAVKQDLSDMKVRRDDFMQALQEVHPAYGVAEADLQRAVRLGIIRYSPHVNANIQSMTRVVNMIRDDGDKTSTSVLFHGPRASGKTALAVHIARESEFPFIKMIRAVDLIGYRDDSGKRDHVQKAFSDAWKSPTSILILDDFERLIQWSPVGPRYSATMLETLTTLIVTEPPEGHRLVVFVTTSQASVLGMLGVDNDFAFKVAVPAVADLRELEAVLDESPSFESDVRGTLAKINQRTGTDRVGVGIKTVLDCTFVARTGATDADQISDTFADLISEKMQDMR